MIICLTGMHRSGTSLLSSFLQHCGVNMGEALAGAGPDNKYGHFEDKEFLEFHKKILNENGCHMYREPNSLKIDDIQRRHMSDLIIRNNEQFLVWVWKDPRTTLFLDYWNDIIPETKFLFVYRDPMTVIDSLFRRKGERYLFLNPLMAADAWLLYNKKILDFYLRFPDKCFVVNISGMNKAPEQSLPKLSEWLDYSLEKPYSDIYHSNDIASSISTITKIYSPFIHQFRGEELTITFNNLEKIAGIPSPE